MKNIYAVGGCVRDLLLNKTPSDIDYVAVGFTPETFLQKFPNAKQVEKSFPVFLVNNYEIALARTERKIGKGYNGFETNIENVSLEDDLKRRDLTVNAIAMGMDDVIIDPYNGIDDINNKILRHVSDAFVEDPLRVYRIARFAAKFPDFNIHSDTKLLMKSLKAELIELTPERVWMETEKALKQESAYRFFEVLAELDLLDVHFKELNDLRYVPSGRGKKHENEKNAFEHCLNVLKGLSTDSPIAKWAALLHDVGKAITYVETEKGATFYKHDKKGVALVKRINDRLKVPNKYKKMAELVCETHMKWIVFDYLKNSTLLKLLKKIEKKNVDLKDYFDIIKSDSGIDLYSTVSFFIKCVNTIKVPEKFNKQGKEYGDLLWSLQCNTLQVLR